MHTDVDEVIDEQPTQEPENDDTDFLDDEEPTPTPEPEKPAKPARQTKPRKTAAKTADPVSDVKGPEMDDSKPNTTPAKAGSKNYMPPPESAVRKGTYRLPSGNTVVNA